MMATTFEKGVQQGLEQGLKQGRLQGLQHAAPLVLEQQFGPLSAGAIQRLNAWPAERLGSRPSPAFRHGRS